MEAWNRKLLIAALMGTALVGGCATESEDDAELNAERQAVVDTSNGLRTINGLSTVNGLRTINGLSTVNGLRTINGLSTVNGLRTINGLRTANGLDTDCTGKTAGVTCTGSPDGLLSAATGMMSSDEGIMTAKYLVRCALPANDSIRIKDYTGGLVTLAGEVGLTPEWKDGQCDAACQEKVSACLMSLTNTAGNHVDVELAAPFTIGTGHSAAFPYQESVFYGNLFDSPPSANFAIGKDYAGLNIVGLVNVGVVTNRLCSIIWSLLGPNACPYIPVGGANFTITDPFGTASNKCTMSDGAGTKCKDKAGKTWNYPITIWRKDKGAT